MSPPPTATTDGLRVGDERDVLVGVIAHGGHAIAHTDGRTLLVRHAIPGERVRVRVTELGRRVVRADAVAVLEPSPTRVMPPCVHARPGGCGGCDFQHVSLDGQRELKAQVLRDALVRFGRMGEPPDVRVEPVPGDSDGLRWRTRMRWARTPAGGPGLRAHRSHDLVAIDSCPIARAEIDAGRVPRTARGGQIELAVGSDGTVGEGAQRVLQEVAGRRWRIAADSFWQVHPGLAAALQEVVRDFGDPGPGQTWWDLYCGSGLLSAVLGEAVGPSGTVAAVDLAGDGIRQARRALHDLPQVVLHAADVTAWLQAGRGSGVVHGVVLDPPRTGAGAEVMELVADATPAIVIYVACDPVALGRDVDALSARGYRLDRIRAFDAFPMTHHFETVARLVRADGAR